MNDSENTLIAHLDALRRTLLRCVTVTALLYPVGYLASPYVINALVQWSFPESAGKLHYFAPNTIRIKSTIRMISVNPSDMLYLLRFVFSSGSF